MKPQPRYDVTDPYCWACGATNGDYEEFVDATLTLVLCEPHDQRFPCDLGVQWFCSACLVGRAMMLRPAPPTPRRWFARAGTRGHWLAAWSG